jgi:TolB-like protein
MRSNAPMIARVQRAGSAAAMVVVLTTLVACIAFPLGQRYRRATQLPHAVDNERAMMTVVAILTESGYAPQLISDRARTVSTDWRMEAGLFSVVTGFRTRDRVIVTMSDSSVTITGETQMRNGPGLFGDEDQHDSDWMGSDPSDEVRSHWDSIQSTIASRFAALPPALDPGPSAEPPQRTTLKNAHPSPTPPMLTTGAVISGARLRVAVAKFNNIGIEKEQAHILVDRLRSELAGTGRFQVVEREQMEAILAEQGFQQSELCDTDECVVEVGRLIGVSAIVAGTIGKIGNTHTVTARMISVETGEIVSRASDDCPCEIDGLLAGMQRLAVLLANRLELEEFGD